jgi:predicted GIY-YIG superfamily endonuclease
MTEYKIYGLKDPTDKTIKYVGVTKNIETRYKQHIYTKPQDWILSLKESNLRPEVVILETIITDDRNVALNKEKEYISSHNLKK